MPTKQTTVTLPEDIYKKAKAYGVSAYVVAACKEFEIKDRPLKLSDREKFLLGIILDRFEVPAHARDDLKDAQRFIVSLRSRL